MDATTAILPSDALKGVRVGLSASGSPDLARLGLLEPHFRLALGEITRSVLVLGGSLAYGGHLDPEGYTAFLASELNRYGRHDRPLEVCLAWSEHRRVPLSRLAECRREFGLHGRITCLSPDGVKIDPSEGRGDEPAVETDPAVIARSLTAMRRYMSGIVQGRVLIGGKRHGFQGDIPGLVEEALLALAAQQPLYLAGGFGGVVLDMIRTLVPDAAAWLPPHAETLAEDPRCTDALRTMAARAHHKGWAGLQNGLNDEENHRLAATHRPSEIAALVSLGLGRIAAGDRASDGAAGA